MTKLSMPSISRFWSGILSKTILSPAKFATYLSVGLIVIPPIITPINEYGYEESKVITFVILAILTLSVTIWAYPTKILRHSKVLFLSLFFILSITLSTWYSPDQNLSLWGRSPYYQGLFLYLLLWSTYLIFRTVPITRKLLTQAITFTCLVISILAITDFMAINLANIQIATYAGRVVSTFGQPNFYSGYLALCLPIIWTSRLEIVLVTVFGIALSESRSGVFLASLTLICWMLSLLNRALKFFVIGLISATLLVAVAASYWYLSGVVWEELDRPKEPLYFLHQFPETGFYFWQFDSSYHPQMRLYIWPVIGQLIYYRPIFGHGFGSLVDNFPNVPLAKFHSLQTITVDSAHNQLLDLAYSAGLITTIFWLLIVAFSLKQPGYRPLKYSLVLYLVWSFFQNQSVVHLAFFWMLIGLLDREQSLV